MRKLPIIALLCLPLASVVCCTQSKQAAENQPQWELVWQENFNGDSFDTAVWSKIPRGTADWNNCMSDYDSLYAVADGRLILKGIATPKGLGDSVPYITGGIYTKGKKGFHGGRLEISAKLNDVQGAWPAIWLMPMQPEQSWPWCGEIDIMERLSYDTIAYQTVHSNYTYNEKITDNPKSSSTASIDPAAFNVYAVEMYPDSVVFYINGERNFAYPRIATNVPGQFPFDQEWYLMLDMQLGGNWVGEVAPADLPAIMEVEWVKYYQKGDRGQ